MNRRREWLRRYRKLLRTMHRTLQHARLVIEPESPMPVWSDVSLSMVLNKPSNPTAEKMLDAEFHCLRAAESLDALLKSRPIKSITPAKAAG